jgi:hypothetical protein
MSDTAYRPRIGDVPKLLSPLKPDVLRAIDDAAGLDGAIDQLKASPSAFVLYGGRAAGGNVTATGLVQQRVVWRFSVVLGFSGVAGTGGGAKNDDIEAVENAVIDALVGARPEGWATHIVFAGSRVLLWNMVKHLLFIECNFSTDYHERKPA